MAELAQEAGLSADEPALLSASKLSSHLWNVAWHNAPGTAAGDADALHDMRVAIRRLRSALQNFEGSKNAPLLGKRLRAEMAEQRKKLGKLGDVLGAVRDCDVLDEYLREYSQKELKTEIGECAGLSSFERFLQSERATAFAPMVKKINRAQDAKKLRETFARFALGLPGALHAPDVSRLSLREAFAEVLPQRIEEVEDLLPHLSNDNDASGHHELRKAMKRLRYSLEFFAPCLNEPVKPHLKTLTQLQDQLGEMNDRHVLHLTALRAFAPNVKAPHETDDWNAENSAVYPDSVPSDVAAFLDFGASRSRELLGAVRAAWEKQSAANWPHSLLKSL